MKKKPGTTRGTKKQKANPKLLDLPAKTVKRGDPGSIKGGTSIIAFDRKT